MIDNPPAARSPPSSSRIQDSTASSTSSTVAGVRVGVSMHMHTLSTWLVPDEKAGRHVGRARGRPAPAWAIPTEDASAVPVEVHTSPTWLIPDDEAATHVVASPTRASTDPITAGLPRAPVVFLGLSGNDTRSVADKTSTMFKSTERRAGPSIGVPALTVGEDSTQLTASQMGEVLRVAATLSLDLDVKVDLCGLVWNTMCSSTARRRLLLSAETGFDSPCWNFVSSVVVQSCLSAKNSGNVGLSLIGVLFGPQAAEKILLQLGTPAGSFLVRRSAKYGPGLALSSHCCTAAIRMRATHGVQAYVQE